MATQHWALKQVTSPACEPISLTELKAHARITIASDDDMLARDLRSARQRFEKILDRQLVCSSFVLSQDFFAPVERLLEAIFGDLVRIPRPPLLEVTSVQYVDTTGTLTTLSPTWYQVDTFDEPARIRPSYGYYWPVTRYQLAAVQISFTAGHLVPFTVQNLGTSTFQAFGRQPQNGEAWKLSVSGAGAAPIGALPAGLLTGTTYYVVNASGFNFQLALTANGAPVAISDLGGLTLGQLTPATTLAFLGEAPETALTRIKQLASWEYLNRETIPSQAADDVYAAWDRACLSEWPGEYR